MKAECTQIFAAGSNAVASIAVASIAVASIAVASIALASIAFASIALASIALASIALASIALASIDLASIALASIALASYASAFVSFAKHTAALDSCARRELLRGAGFRRGNPAAGFKDPAGGRAGLLAGCARRIPCPEHMQHVSAAMRGDGRAAMRERRCARGDARAAMRAMRCDAMRAQRCERDASAAMRGDGRAAGGGIDGLGDTLDLVRRFYSEAIPPVSAAAAADVETRRANLELAFRVAEEQAGVPALLEVQDMIDCYPRPDSRSVILYVSQLYEKLAAEES